MPRPNARPVRDRRPTTGTRPSRSLWSSEHPARIARGPTTVTTKSAISTAGLTKHYPGVQALTDLSLDVPAGTIYGFLGPNGAGKSTTIKLLAGLTRPTGGTASVAGIPIAAGPAYRREVGYLVQDARFQQLYEQYQDTVLRAAREIEDAAIGFAQLRTQVTILDESVQAARRSASSHRCIRPGSGRTERRSTQSSRGSGWQTRPIDARRPTPAGCASASASPRHWSAARPCSCWTSRSARSTRSGVARCST